MGTCCACGRPTATRSQTGSPVRATCGTARILRAQTKESSLPENYSKERKQAEAAFAKIQDHPGDKTSVAPGISDADQNTARLKAARLERDGSAGELKKL